MRAEVDWTIRSLSGIIVRTLIVVNRHLMTIYKGLPINMLVRMLAKLMSPFVLIRTKRL